MAGAQNMRGMRDGRPRGGTARENPTTEDPATENPAIDEAKRTRRHAVFARRRALGDGERERYGRALAAHAARLLGMARPSGTASGIVGGDAPTAGSRDEGTAAIAGAAPVIAAFVSMGTEPPMEALLRELLGAGARLLVPRLGAGRDLGWAWLDDLDALGDMGERRPQEPDAPTLPADAVSTADLVLMPALEVDDGGNRLGRGGGWYDRMLTLRGDGVPAVAVVYPWERVGASLPHAAHDMPVDATLTDAGVVACSRIR